MVSSNISEIKSPATLQSKPAENPEYPSGVTLERGLKERNSWR